MAHISPIEVHSMEQYVPVCALLFLSLLCSDTNLARFSPPGSLAADWVVIVIKSSCTAGESTKLSANGWSSVGGWGGLWRGHGHCPLNHPPTQCLPFFFLNMVSVYASQSLINIAVYSKVSVTVLKMTEIHMVQQVSFCFFVHITYLLSHVLPLFI